MLFNTYSFIFLFLLPTISIFYLIQDRYKVAFWFVIIVSFIFYIQWSIKDLIILLTSILINYSFAYMINRYRKKLFLYLAILFNISLLGYFKYSGLLHLTDKNIVLPLAISFFTFQQISYIVDIYKKKIVFESFERYLFFVSFFPQLIAGPIVHYNYMMDQVNRSWSISFESLKKGIVYFSIGLFSKVVLADNLAIDSYDSWSGIFSYSFMIYFDFSGYASMAIGLALMFNIVLPQNFNSPYKARNLVDFWRRWHITLSLFLKDHIYIPLGGNRYGILVQGFALFITMLLGGLWHGAGWGFVLWGAMHGIGLIIVHITKITLSKYIAITLTFIYVTLLWVLFFSSDISSAIDLYKKLFLFDNFGGDTKQYIMLFFSSIIVFVLPNISQLIKPEAKDTKLPSYWGYIAGGMFFISLKFMANTPSNSFVYFNF